MPRLSRDQHVLFLTITLILIFIFHLSYLNNGFTWLDHGDIERGRALLSLSSLPTAFTTHFAQTGFYRPLVTILNSLDYSLYKFWAPGYHLTNLLLHLGVSLLAARFISLFFSINHLEKLLIILLVGLHPIGWLPVGAISYRQELLLSFFTLTGIYYHVKARTSGKTKYILLTFISFLAALFSKETALFLLPAIILFWELTNVILNEVPYSGTKSKDLSRMRDSSSDKLRDSSTPIKSGVGTTITKFTLRLLFAEFSVILIYLLLRLHAVPELWRTSSLSLPFPQALATRFTAAGRLLFQLFSPFRPGLSDAVKVSSFNNFGPILLTAAFIFSDSILARRRLRSNWSIALTLLLITLFPALNIIPLPRFYSPHYGYIMLPAAASLAVLFLRIFSKKNIFGKISSLGIALWLLVAAVSTFQAGFQFKNDFTLFAPEVSRDDRFAEGHQYLGDYHFRLQNYQLAATHYQSALRENLSVIAFVDRASVMNNLAGVYLALKKLDEADRLLLELSYKPGWSDNQTLLYNRALIATEKEDWQKVIALLRRPDISWTRPEPLLLLEKALQMPLSD